MLMKLGIGLAIAIAVSIAACAPVESVRIQDDVVKSKTVVSPGRNPVVTATVRTDEEGGALVVQSRETCEQHVEDLHHRTRFTERHSDSTTAAALYGLGGAGVAIGAWVILDAPNIPETGDPKTVNPVGRSGAYATGTSFLSAGTAVLVAAIATSVRARDEVKNLGGTWRSRENSFEELQCHDRSVADTEVLVVTATTRTSLGTTTKKGRLTFTWNTLEKALDTDEPPDVATLEVPGLGAVGRLDLADGRAYFARREVDEVRALASKDSVDEASIHLARASALGANVAEAQKAIAVAPTSVLRAQAKEAKERAEKVAQQKRAEGHLAHARDLIRRKQFDEADGALESARQLGADTDALSAQVGAARAEQTVARWKKHIAQCRKLSTIRSQLGVVSRCDEDCQKVSRRVARDWDELAREKLELSGVDEEDGQALRDMCEQAGCPECPQ
jgi:hypothetical protein